MKKERRSPAKRHAAVERLSIFGLDVRFGPTGLIVYAKHFLLAARSTQVPEDAPNFPLVRAYLVCHALELALKAFLSLKGRSLLELAEGPYGHNLKYLIEEAEKSDLSALARLDEQQRAEIIRASRYYCEKVLEYPALTEAIRAYPNMPNTDVLMAAADALVRSLHEPCLKAE